MFDIKTSAIAAGIAFILSLLIGMLSGASFPILIVRPLIFGALFFVAAALIYNLISRFLPELLSEGGFEAIGNDDIPHPGSRVNITEEEPSRPAVNAAQPDDSEDNLGDISRLIGEDGGAALAAGIRSQSPPPETGAAGLDLQGEDGYTLSGVLGTPADTLAENSFAGGESTANMTAAAPKKAPAPIDFGSMDILPDLDSMAGAFFSDSGEEAEDTTEYSTSTAPVRKPMTGGKSQKLDGDFNPKELAAGLRTILKKEG
jgi:hypothetical protein